jgi:hypothetical protein
MSKFKRDAEALAKGSDPNYGPMWPFHAFPLPRVKELEYGVEVLNKGRGLWTQMEIV